MAKGDVLKVNKTTLENISDKICEKKNNLNPATDTLLFPQDFISNINDLTDTSDANATANNIVASKTAYVNGEKITGAIPIRTSADLTESINMYNTHTITAPAGYYDQPASKQATIRLQTKTNPPIDFSTNPTVSITPDLSSFDGLGQVNIGCPNTLMPWNIKQGVSIFGIQGGLVAPNIKEFDYTKNDRNPVVSIDYPLPVNTFPKVVIVYPVGAINQSNPMSGFNGLTLIASTLSIGISGIKQVSSGYNFNSDHKAFASGGLTTNLTGNNFGGSDPTAPEAYMQIWGMGTNPGFFISKLNPNTDYHFIIFY